MWQGERFAAIPSDMILELNLVLKVLPTDFVLVLVVDQDPRCVAVHHAEQHTLRLRAAVACLARRRATVRRSGGVRLGLSDLELLAESRDRALFLRELSLILLE